MPLEAGLTRQGGAEPSPQGGKGGGAPAPAKERCPRCDSRDTKFCYYNNYNTAQPRHFCKSCRRYWTLGGSLRNVPIGGASRKRLRRSTSDSAGGFRVGAASETPLRVVSGLSTPPAASSLVAERPNSETTAPPLGYGSDHNRLQGPSECRLKLGLGLGCGSGLLPPVEEMGFRLAPTLLWPVDLGTTWPVGAGGEGCFAGRPLVTRRAVPPSAPAEGVPGPATRPSPESFCVGLLE